MFVPVKKEMMRHRNKGVELQTLFVSHGVQSGPGLGVQFVLGCSNLL